MSDYLDNLARKNLAPGDGLKPRLPALFEPVSQSLQPMESAAEANEPERRAFSDAAPTELAPAERPPSLITQPTPARPQAQSTTSPSPTPLRAEVNNVPVNPYQMLRNPMRPVAEPVVAPKEPTMPPSQVDERKSDAMPMPQPVVPKTSDAMPMLQPVVPKAVELPETSRTVAPTIKITIGRVDVRAVMPAQQPKRPAAEPRRPSLSLDEYLKQREGGKR